MTCHSVPGLPLSVSGIDQKESGSVCLEQGPSVLPCVSLARSRPLGALVSGQQRLGEVAGGSPRTVTQAVRVLRSPPAGSVAGHPIGTSRQPEHFCLSWRDSLAGLGGRAASGG